MADPEPAIVGVLPGPDIDRGRIGGVDDDAVKTSPSSAPSFARRCQLAAFVHGFVEPAIGGAEEKMVGLPWKRCKSACVTARGAGDAPPCLRRRAMQGAKQKRKTDEEPGWNPATARSQVERTARGSLKRHLPHISISRIDKMPPKSDGADRIGYRSASPMEKPKSRPTG